jgi:hypothetical protein
LDLSEVFPLVGLRAGDFIAGQTALKAASNKVAKHEKAYSDNQHVFIPLVFVSPRSMNVIFKRIGFAIHKGLVAAQVVAHLPFIHV